MFSPTDLHKQDALTYHMHLKHSSLVGQYILVWPNGSVSHFSLSSHNFSTCNLLGGSALMAYVDLSKHSTFTIGGSMPQVGQHHLLRPTPHLTLQRCGATVSSQTCTSSPHFGMAL